MIATTGSGVQRRASIGSRMALGMIGPPAAVRIREVGPRDGFQNEPEVIADRRQGPADRRCSRAPGLRRIEVTSFVRPDVIPQLADAAEVLAPDRRARRTSRVAS